MGRWIIISLVLIATVIPAVSFASDRPEWSFKLAVVAPEATPWGEVGNTIKKEIEETSADRIQVKWYFGAVMGDEPDVSKKMRIGQLQGGGFTIVGLGFMVPALKILELPFLFESYEEVDHLLSTMDESFRNLFAEKGLHLLGWIEVGFIQLYAKEVLHTWEDFTRTKMWTWSGEPVAHAILETAGVGTIIPLNMPDVFTALQSGIVNAFYGPYYPAIALQWHTHARCMTHWTLAYSPGAIVVKKKAYEKLPEDLRSIFQASWDRHLPRLVKMIREDNHRSFEIMKEAGTKVVEFSDEEMSALRQRVRVVYDQNRDEYYPGWLLDEVLKTLSDYRAGAVAAHPSSSSSE